VHTRSQAIKGSHILEPDLDALGRSVPLSTSRSFQPRQRSELRLNVGSLWAPLRATPTEESGGKLLFRAGWVEGPALENVRSLRIGTDSI